MVNVETMSLELSQNMILSIRKDKKNKQSIEQLLLKISQDLDDIKLELRNRNLNLDYPAEDIQNQIRKSSEQTDKPIFIPSISMSDFTDKSTKKNIKIRSVDNTDISNTADSLKKLTMEN